MLSRSAPQRIASIARKEVIHIVRDPTTLFFALFIPFLQLVMLGYAIDTNVRNVRTLVYDQALTQESRALVRSFENTDDFHVIGTAQSDDELTQAIVSGRVHVGIKIPEEYSRRLAAGQTAQLLVMVDGSESSITAEVVNVANAIALRESLGRLLRDGQSLPIESRPRVLFNPDTRSPNFFIPGLLCILCQMMAVMLAATSIVREKEQGTLEQLFMTPVRPVELILGKLAPYLVLTLLEFIGITILMRVMFQVPIRGNMLVLVGLALPFILTMLGVGLAISTWASTRDAAMQMAMGTILPSIFLSGYIFPIDAMPLFFQGIALVIPASWMIDAARGIILRGADWTMLTRHAIVLWVMAVVIVLISSRRFRRHVQ